MLNLCEYCRQANNTCPIYAPSVPTHKCVEWKPFEDILEEDYCKISIQNYAVNVK